MAGLDLGSGQSQVLTLTTTTITVSLASEELLAYTSWPEGVHLWGWRLTATDSNESTRLWQLALPAINGRLLGATAFKAYLHQLLGTRGRPEMPWSVHRVLASSACRSACMFGDSLDAGEGQELLDKLKATQLCFSCAHGRPTMAPLADLAALPGGFCPRQGAWSQAKGETDMGKLKRKLLQHLYYSRHSFRAAYAG